jgi:hypothetical protein
MVYQTFPVNIIIKRILWGVVYEEKPQICLHANHQPGRRGTDRDSEESDS